MQAYWLPKHFPLGNIGKLLTPDELWEQGIEVTSFPPTDEGRAAVKAFAIQQSYPVSDEVSLDQDSTQPETLTAFATEHRHTTDEVRWVLEGKGVFDVRGLNDQWIRINVVAGDLLILPARRWHLFILMKRIKVARLFGQSEGWKAEYRHPNTVQ